MGFLARHEKLFLIYYNGVMHLDLDGALVAIEPAVVRIPNWCLIQNTYRIFITRFFVVKFFKKKNTVDREAMFNINLDAYGYQLAYT